MRGSLIGAFAPFVLAAATETSTNAPSTAAAEAEPVDGERQGRKAEPVSAQVFIDASSCSSLQQGALLSAIRTELAASAQPIELLLAGHRAGPDLGLVIVDCDLDRGNLTIAVVTTAAGGRRDALPLDVSDIPIVARPRVTAVAIVEWALALLHPRVTPAPQSDVGERGPGTPSTPPGQVGGELPTPDGAAPPPSVSPGRAGVAFGGRARTTGPHSLITRGIWGAVHRRLAQQWQLSGQLGYETASTTTLLGDARLHWVGGSVGGAYLVLKVPRLAVGVQLEVSDAVMVPRSRLGLPEPTQHHIVVSGHAQLEIGVPLLGGWSLETALAGGYVIQGVHYTAAGSNVFDLSREFYFAQLGIGHEL